MTRHPLRPRCPATQARAGAAPIFTCCSPITTGIFTVACDNKLVPNGEEQDGKPGQGKERQPAAGAYRALPVPRSAEAGRK